MKVKMLKTSAGPDEVFAQGREYEVSRKEAEALIRDNAAIPVVAHRSAPVVETAEARRGAAQRENALENKGISEEE